MTMTIDKKLSAILRMGFDDGPLAETLARKLSADDIRGLEIEIKAIVDCRIQSRCQRLQNILKQKDRLAEVDRLASGWDGGRKMASYP